MDMTNFFSGFVIGAGTTLTLVGSLAWGVLIGQKITEWFNK